MYSVYLRNNLFSSVVSWRFPIQYKHSKTYESPLSTKLESLHNRSCLCVCEQDYCKSNQPISLKLGIMIGSTNRKN